jgi:hypothetical protein
MSPKTALFPYDVFLGYSARDKTVVRDLANRLKAGGLKVWFDAWELKTGDDLPFEGECFDVLAVCRWRDRVLAGMR